MAKPERKTHARNTQMDSRLAVSIHRLAQAITGIEYALMLKETNPEHNVIAGSTRAIVKDLIDWHTALGEIVEQLKQDVPVSDES